LFLFDRGKPSGVFFTLMAFGTFEDHHNSSVVRVGGPRATALLGRASAAHGPALLAAFDAGMIAGTAACAVAILPGASSRQR
jgi:hypothetical protein